MGDDRATLEFLAGEARACADGLWETQGPGAEPFRAEDAEFARISCDVLEAMEMDLGRALSPAERRAMEKSFADRIEALLAALMARATRIRGLMRGGR